MKNEKIFEDIAKEGELSYQVAERFAKESTKEQFASKILEIIHSKSSDFEVINEIAFLCKSLEQGEEKNEQD